MEKPKVKVEFIITGDKLDFNLVNLITDRLKIKPNRYWIKGDTIEGANIRNIDTCWEVCTDYEESYYINDQLTKIISKIKYKKDIINDITETYDLECLFSISTNFRNGQTPAMVLEKDIIEFASDIKAEIYFDLYSYYTLEHLLEEDEFWREFDKS
ncbi:hypothetical protein CLPU_9c00750 [Gottschalkia purinilytica]|uniref:DUF4279 domain-containing protein n=1 Tax=Gottschalkia purinilytica TaxID=1503 RepID=A0A0L0W9F9_GOTPU|nr:DUF4279 domain-containing protein [Gottschalkia purinilytica]KNF08179.1 hypothetical protein CLPU_9c00750 [Gottschalkia purinilytica]